jgi:hypothetical protein
MIYGREDQDINDDNIIITDEELVNVLKHFGDSRNEAPMVITKK